MNDRDFSTRLAAEVKQWVLDGIIDSETAARVVSRYPCDPDNHRSRAGGQQWNVGWGCQLRNSGTSRHPLACAVSDTSLARHWWMAWRPI